MGCVITPNNAQIFMTLLIQKQCKDEKEREKIIRKLEKEDWAVNIENIEDDLDYEEVEGDKICT